MSDQNKHFVMTNPETGESWNLPVMKGTTGPDVIDVRKFYADTGAFTFDPGFTSTASCEIRRLLLSMVMKVYYSTEAIR